jgi:hypothetical protein
VINPRKKIDKVIIYKRDPIGNNHEVFIGSLIEVINSDQEGRRQINMANISLIGTTTLNWNEFTD